MAKADKPDGAGKFARLLRWRWILAVWAVVLVVELIIVASPTNKSIAYSDFKAQLAANNIKTVRISPTKITGTYRKAVSSKTKFKTTVVQDRELLAQLLHNNVKVTGVGGSSSMWSGAVSWIFWIALFVGFMIWIRRSQGGGAGLLSVGRSKAKLYMEDDIKVSFADVAGVDEAKEELQEIIEFLTDPGRFKRLGGHLPKGILLVGPPGTGKTLLARAVAGEARVPFFSISGSAFVEMFVGVGAARVRDLFKDARAKSPCIIFIDELDALGKVRSMGPMAHEEREQTLNQLLVELDGFDPQTGVILMAATNRPEILDPALLRPGRFDRQVSVDRPDRAGRLAILQVHAKKIRMADDLSLEAIAAMSPGLAGADLANIINEAALLAVRRGGDAVTNSDVQEAVERVVTGIEKRSRVLSPTEKKRVAHHELGHALTALSIPGADPVHKISIIPRGVSALGYTMQLPHEERFLLTRTELEQRIAVLLGGRVAEEIVYGDISTGAQDDLLRATDIARSMVVHYGMSDALGHVAVERPRSASMAAYGAAAKEYSEETARLIDREVRRIIDDQHERVLAILGDRRRALQRAAAELLVAETLTGEQLQAIVGHNRASPLRAA